MSQSKVQCRSNIATNSVEATVLQIIVVCLNTTLTTNTQHTCVPAMANMFPATREDRQQITKRDVRLFERVLGQVLPSSAGGPTANALDTAIRGLAAELRPRVE